MASIALTTYDPSDLLVWYSSPVMATEKNKKGEFFVSPHFAPGTFLTIQREADTWDTVTGVRGEIVRIESKNTSGLITLSLFAGSPASDFLTAVTRLSGLLNRGTGSLTIKLNRTEAKAAGETDFSDKYRIFVVADPCWIKTMPRMTFGEGAPVLDWVIQSENLKVLPMYLDPDSKHLGQVE